MVLVRMEQSTRFCVVWKTDLPTYCTHSISSPYFFFQASKNYLQLIYKDQDSYELVLQRADQCDGLCKTFGVTVMFENEFDNKVHGVGSYTKVQSDSKVLWKFVRNEIFNICSNYNANYYNSRSTRVKIVCSFHDDPQYNNKKNDPSAESFSSDSVSGFPPNMESLSLDFGNLLKDETCADAELRCGDRAISAHRSVLAARSDVFAAMFRNGFTESRSGVVDIIDTPVIDKFLEYIYTGRIKEPPDSEAVSELYVAADKYAVHALKETCRGRMIDALSAENCIGHLIIADAHSDAAFKKAAMTFICSQRNILESEAWLRFSEQPSKLAIEVYRNFVRSCN